MRRLRGMPEYWSKRFAQEGMIWGSEPSLTALHARDLFRKHNVKSVLVPGAGYGRNTKVFSGEFETVGIELSGTALNIAGEWDSATRFIAGSALDPREDIQVDAVYCYDVLHLFLEMDRRRLVTNCLEQVRPGGLLYFTCFSDEDPNNGCGELLEPGTYEYKKGKFAYFFSEEELRRYFLGCTVVETGTFLENLPSPGGGTHQYILRYIIAGKI
jgi:SAM-dependent methyltransferase